jgi:hypothetical protein
VKFPSKYLVAVAVALCTVVFIGGRQWEERSAYASASRRREARPPEMPIEPASVHVQPLDIVTLPFPELFETLRSAPVELRDEWGRELMRMPEGPRRAAALRGFYKLLVQLDPVRTVRSVRDLKDKDVQSIAVEAIAKAAPESALSELAKVMVTLPPDVLESGDENYLDQVIQDWVVSDPLAVGKFLVEHRSERLDNFRSDVVGHWAALDPEQALNWMNQQQWDHDKPMFQFVFGWYEKDRKAAVQYAVTHLKEFGNYSEAIGQLFPNLYSDAPDEAQAFLDAIPPENWFYAFHSLSDVTDLPVSDDPAEQQHSSQAVAHWVVKLPDKYWKKNLHEIFESWNTQNLSAVSWIVGLPESVRGEAADEYSLPIGDPIIPLIQSIYALPDASLRDRLLLAAKRNFHSPREEIQKELDEAHLSPEEQQKVEQFLE